MTIYAPSGTFVVPSSANPALSAAGGMLELQREGNVPVPSIYTLIGGQEDESSPSVGSCTVAPDLVNFKLGIQGWGLTMSGAVTATAMWDNPVTGVIGDNPMVMKTPPAVIGMWIYLADATKVTSIELDIWQKTGPADMWFGAVNSGYVTGWNLIRFHAAQGVLVNSEWGTVWRLRLVIGTNAATNVTIGHIFGEIQPKAQILLIHDSGYSTSFYTQGAYAALQARKIPVTVAVDPGLLGTGSGINTHMTEAQFLAMMADGNGNAATVHAWDSTVTSSMTAAQLRANQMQGTKWLEARGLRSLWRGAFLQNAATNAAAIQSLVMAYATPTSSSGLDAWPPIDRWNIPRIGLHGRTTAQMDTDFATLQTTHQFACMYLHGVDAGGGAYVTPANWAYWLSKVDAGIAAGWLEFVTFEQLVARSGLKNRQTLGDWTTEYFDASGARQTVRLP